MLAVHGPVQRRALIVVARLDARAARDQVVDDDRVPDLRRVVQRLQPGVVGEVNVGAGLDGDDQRGLRGGQKMDGWKAGTELGINVRKWVKTRGK